MLVQWFILLPPDAGEGWDGGRAQVACGQTLHPHPGPPPSQGEGSLCANLMESDLGWCPDHPSDPPTKGRIDWVMRSSVRMHEADLFAVITI
jgi:hypothetical protein